MTATLTITIDDQVLEVLRKSGTIKIHLDAGGGGGSGGTKQPRQGSLPDRVLTWAQDHGKEFGVPDVAKRFKLSRAHASMVLSKLANGPYGIDRPARGVYTATGRPAGTTRRKKKKTKRK